MVVVMPPLLLAASLTVASLLAAVAAGAVAGEMPLARGFIHVEGKHFVDADGRTFAIKGISLGNWLMPEGYMFKFRVARSPREIESVIERLFGPDEAARFWDTYRDRYISAEDIRFIADSGFNTVRVPLHYKLFIGPDGRPDPNAAGFKLLDNVVTWSQAAGLRVIIDMHAAPGGQTGVNHDDGSGYPLLFYVPTQQRLATDLWRAIAERYKDASAVLGYDLLNEPISPYHDEQYLNRRLEPVYRDFVGAIRSVDTAHVIFMAASQWSTNFEVFGPPFAANVAYTYHKFWARPDRDSIQDYVNFSNRYNVPVFLGEAGELDDNWNDAFRRLHEAFGIGWCFWTYKNLDSLSTVVSIVKPPGWDAIAAAGSGAPAANPTGEVISQDEARAIGRDYLTAIMFANGQINAGYLRSLGLRVPNTAP